MAEQLTEQQYTAVHNRGGKLLVSAAAGSGKTKVLIDRLLSYIMEPSKPANIDDFLLITYTKAAAAELRGKIASKLSELIAEHPENTHLHRQMQRLYLAKISTVHSYCADILREYAYRLDISADFRVADENECVELQTIAMEKLLEHAYETAQENPEFCAFIDSQGFGRDDRQVPDIILKVYNSARCHLNVNEWLDWCVLTVECQGTQDAGQTLWGKYLMARLRDYLDLQIQTLNRCLKLSESVDGMAKPVILLSDTVCQLSVLRNCNTWDEIVSHSEINYGRLVFPKNCTDIALAEQIKAVRTACKNGMDRILKPFTVTSDQVLADLKTTNASVKGLISLVKQFDQDYSALKKRRRVLDFGDLEHKTLDLLLGKNRTGPTTVADEIGSRYLEVMVDEYQDSNAVQDSIFSALTRKKQNCFMVGDVKQSIYQFRLADPDIFLDKYNRYVPAEEAVSNEGRKVLLSKNFRSSAGVIGAVNDVFSAAMSAQVGGLEYGADEKLYEGVSHIPLGDTEIELYGVDVQSDTYCEEANVVADRICCLLDGKHMIRSGDNLRAITPDDIVILLRSPGSVGGEFQYALESRGVACAAGNSDQLLQAPEIQVLRSILQIIDNPLQDIPLVAVLTSPVFGFTADDLAVLRGNNRKLSIYELLQKSTQSRVIGFLQTLSRLRLDARLFSLSELLERILLETHLDSIYSAMDNSAERIENIQTFCQLAANYESTGRKDIDLFLKHLETLESRGMGNSGESKTIGAVTIMSIHKSKGLEFPVVFLCGLSRSFNMESVRAPVLCHKDLGLGLSCLDLKLRVRYPSIARFAIAERIKAESISEEMRVLYVAMTRARDRLIMTYAAKNLARDLQDLSSRMDISASLLMTSQADCPGTWVLLAALRRIDAGSFFQLCDNTPKANAQDAPWLIQVVHSAHEGGDSSKSVQDADILPNEDIVKLKTGLSFTYEHIPATLTPSKQTATQLKGRIKDAEAAEASSESSFHTRPFRKPSFLRHISTGAAYGTAVHAVMQYISFTECTSEDNVRKEVDRLLQQNRITKDQADMVNCGEIARLFESEIGRKLQTHPNILREFKFSILQDASEYYPNISDEQVLLQGVVDCAILDDDGITVLDFKTDYVTEETLPTAVSRYKAQVCAYANALSRIYQMKIKAAYLYFFRLNRFELVE